MQRTLIRLGKHSRVSQASNMERRHTGRLDCPIVVRRKLLFLKIILRFMPFLNYGIMRPALGA